MHTELTSASLVALHFLFVSIIITMIIIIISNKYWNVLLFGK